MIYFDNASTSFPKAPGVSDFVKRFVDEDCFNISRGAYSAAWKVSQMVFETRGLIAEFFHGRDKNVAFSSGVTQSLNVALKGLLTCGDRVVTSTMEHNAVLRPLAQLSKQGVAVDYAACDSSGNILFDSLEELLKTAPKMLVLTHASNVCGTIMPIEKIGALCEKHGVLFVVDAAQTAGVVKIDVTRAKVDALCFTGHKGLLALPGIGGCLFSDRAAQLASTLIEGGTGSFSDSTEMPSLLPDKFEAGTLNLPGIASLNSSLTHLSEVGTEAIFKHEKALQERFENGLKNIKKVRTVGTHGKERCAVTSLDFLTMDNGEASFILDSEHNIMTRSGLHCAPLTHKTLGTFPKGTVRVSFGHNNTFAEVDEFLNVLSCI